MDQSSINSIAELAVDAIGARRLDTHQDSILLRDGNGGEFVTSLEHLAEHRSRFRGTFRTSVIAELFSYITDWREHCGSTEQPQAFIDPDKMTATAIFNLGDLATPGHADHRAELALKKSAAYAALTSRPQHFNQRQLAEWLEDWRDYLTPINDAGESSNLVSAIAAVRDVTVDKARSEQHTVRDLGATHSAMESIDAKSAHTLPAAFEFNCVPFEGLSSRVLVLRLGVITSDDKLHFTLRTLQAEAVTEAIAMDFRDVLSRQLGISCRVRIGQFTP